ncbi:hypothetical protein [Streptomyces fumanus]|uniref:Uncharacterized protein n=1 Tax=Streptomyces fumanus TaxID=67302 RepID=A0A919DW68_9ACTN|nr:hypothetical protein [Streptomyces fumanus]GHE85295.1 hypothetical protein GCM10018772_05640 [Streptomyces fumanus]
MGSCSTGNPFLDAVLGFFQFLFDPVGTIIGLIAKAILAAAVSVFASLTFQVPTLPRLSEESTAGKINGETQWIVVYLAVGSLLFAAVRMAIERRSNAGITALKGIVRVLVVSTAATTVVGVAATVADDYSQYLIGLGAKNLLQDVGSCSDSGIAGNFLLLILGFLLLIAAIIQTILMYIRLGVMIILLGTLPVAAAASMTDWGGGWWRKHIGWLIAWLLYKPAAGLVMYAGSVMINTSDDAGITDGGTASERIAGIGVLLLSAVALPALLKLVVPATAALGGASAHSGAMDQVGGALATGARSLGGRIGGSGSGGDSGSAGRAGPSGASGSAGGSGSSGSSGAGGANGAAGASGGGGRTGPGGAAGGSTGGGAEERAGAGAASGGGRAAAAAGGPTGAAAAAAIGAAVSAARFVGKTASGALDGADGEQGHNGSHPRH